MMKPGDLVRFVWTPNRSRKRVDEVGVLIKYARAHGSDIYYDVLVNGKIEMVHEDEIRVISEAG